MEKIEAKRTKRANFGFPQELKPSMDAVLNGAAEAAPFQNRSLLGLSSRTRAPACC